VRRESSERASGQLGRSLWARRARRPAAQTSALGYTLGLARGEWQQPTGNRPCQPGRPTNEDEPGGKNGRQLAQLNYKRPTRSTWHRRALLGARERERDTQARRRAHPRPDLLSARFDLGERLLSGDSWPVSKVQLAARVSALCYSGAINALQSLDASSSGQCGTMAVRVLTASRRQRRARGRGRGQGRVCRGQEAVKKCSKKRRKGAKSVLPAGFFISRRGAHS